jgi:putative MATE family efflux protein
MLALAIGLGVAVFGSVLLDPIVESLGGGGGAAVRETAKDYLRVSLPAMPLFLLGVAAISVLQAAGNTRTPFVIGIAANAVNAVLNWFLVFGHGGAPRLGAIGSACSTVIATTLECVLAVWALASRRSPVSLRAIAGVDPFDGARRVVRIAWSAFGERVVYHVGYLAFVRFVVGLGGAAMAANQALVSIESIAFLTADGFAVASGALVAQRLGAGDPKRAETVGWITAALCAAILALFGLGFATLAEPLIRVFRDDPAIVAMGRPALRFAALAQIPMAVAVVLGSSMRGAGATGEVLLVSLLGALVVRLAATWWFVSVLHLGLLGVWMGSTADWVVRCVVYAWRWRAGAWRNAR